MPFNQLCGCCCVNNLGLFDLFHAYKVAIWYFILIRLIHVLPNAWHSFFSLCKSRYIRTRSWFHHAILKLFPKVGESLFKSLCRPMLPVIFGLLWILTSWMLNNVISRPEKISNKRNYCKLEQHKGRGWKKFIAFDT